MADSLLDFSGSLLDVVVLEGLLPAVHALDHFEVLVELTLLVGIPVGVLVVGVVVERVLQDVVAFGVVEGAGRHSSEMRLVECQKFIHYYGFFPVLLEGVLG